MSALALPAQNASFQTHTVQSEAFEGEREIRVYLPDRYFQDSVTQFSVIYLLDCQSELVWNLAVGNLGYLVGNYQVMPMMLVGVVSENRGSEFSPPAPVLTQHFREEIKPLVEEKYRAGGIDILMGHSWGGAFVGQTLFSENRDLFDAYVGISPSLGANGGVILSAADSVLNQENELAKIFLCTTGDQGIQEAEAMQEVAMMDSIIQKRGPKSLIWKTKTYPGHTHWSCVSAAMSYSLLEISRQFFPDEYVIRQLSQQPGKPLREKLPAFFKEKEAQYGYAFRPSAGYWEYPGDDFRELGELEIAEALYLFSIAEGNSQDMLLHFKLAQVYDEMGIPDKAKKYFLKTDALLEKQKEELKESLYNSVKKAVEEKLGG